MTQTSRSNCQARSFRLNFLSTDRSWIWTPQRRFNYRLTGLTQTQRKFQPRRTNMYARSNMFATVGSFATTAAHHWMAPPPLERYVLTASDLRSISLRAFNEKQVYNSVEIATGGSNLRTNGSLPHPSLESSLRSVSVGFVDCRNIASSMLASSGPSLTREESRSRSLSSKKRFKAPSCSRPSRWNMSSPTNNVRTAPSHTPQIPGGRSFKSDRRSRTNEPSSTSNS